MTRGLGAVWGRQTPKKAKYIKKSTPTKQFSATNKANQKVATAGVCGTTRLFSLTTYLGPAVWPRPAGLTAGLLDTAPYDPGTRHWG